jgi:hypothetical protein
VFKEGTNVMPVYSNASRPLLIDDPLMHQWANDVFAGGKNELPYEMSESTAKAIKDAGYDYVHYADPHKSNEPHEYIMLDPARQIKSAIGNRGTYDPNEPSITKAHGGIVRMAEGGDVSAEREQAELDRMRLELSNSPVIEATPQSTTQKLLGTVGGYMDRAGKFINKSLEPIAESNPVKTFLADMFLASPLKGAGTALQDYTKTSRDITEEQPYVRSPLTGSGETLRLDPRVIDIAQFATPAVRGATKLAGEGAKALTPFAKSTAEMATDLYVQGKIPGMPAPNAYVIKPKGGNWVTEEVDKTIGPLKVKVEGSDPAVRLKMVEDSFAKKIERNPSADRTELEQAQARFAPDIAINNCLSTKLNKYIKNEMGTPEDPIRKLADQGKLHTGTEYFPRTLVDEFSDVSPTSYLGERRSEAGFPAKSYAETLEGKNWEASTDAAIQSQKAGDL